jgi:hypothetical protein
MPEIIDFHQSKEHLKETSSSSDQMTQQQTCVSPSSVVGYEQEEVANMFGSHDWKVDESMPHGKKGVLIHFHCLECDAEGYATVIDNQRDVLKAVSRRNKKRRSS